MVRRVIWLAVDKLVESIDPADVVSKAVATVVEEVDTDEVGQQVFEKTDWGELIDYSDLAGEVDYRQLSMQVDLSEIAAELDVEALSSEMVERAMAKLEVDYDILGQQIDYSELSKQISPLEALGGTADDEPPRTVSIPGALVGRLLERAVEALLTAANEMVEKEDNNNDES